MRSTCRNVGKWTLCGAQVDTRPRAPDRCHRQFLPWPRRSQGGCHDRVAWWQRADWDRHRIFPARGERRGAQRAPGRRASRVRGHQPLVIAPRPAGAGQPAPSHAAPSTVSRSSGCRSVPFPGTGASGSAWPPRPSSARCSRTGPSWSTWPARSSSARWAAGRPGGCGCRWWPSTRPTCPGTPGPTSWGRLAEAAAWRWLRDIHNAADRTLAPSTGVSRPARRARRAAHLAVGPRRGHPAVQPGGPQRPAAPGAGAGRRGAGRVRRPAGPGEAGRAAGRGGRAAGGAAGHRGRRPGRGPAAPG